MTWVDVAAEEDVLPDTSVIVTVDGKDIGLIRWGSRVYAVRNFCGHAGAPIAEGKVFPRMTCVAPGAPTVVDVEHPELRCPWHHWGFDLETGACTAPVRRPRLKVYPVDVRAGRVFVEV